MTDLKAVAFGPPTREEGLRRLEGFLPRAGRAYARLRNHDFGPGAHAQVSTLSPWIRHRLINEQEVVAAVLGRHGFAAAEKFVQEVFWRTYWKGWLELRPAVWRDYRESVDRLAGELDRSAGLRDRWEAATGGRTGIECFDSWARELVETGYLHNHARMWFASIWIFTLDLPWQLGADFFLRHLLDGDPASNTLSWRWVAGLQTRGKTYLARPDNIARYTDGRFNPEGQLAKAAPPLDGPAPPPPAAPPPAVSWTAEAPTGLLLTEEDLHPDFLLGSGRNFPAVATLSAPARRSPLAVSPVVTDFVRGAMAQAMARLATDAEPGPSAGTPDELVRWARRAGLRQVVTAYTPVGPAARAADELSDTLAARGIALIRPLRAWDRLAWPHATHGFFRFRERIPRILSAVRDEAARG